jgi:hypothetical protein
MKGFLLIVAVLAAAPVGRAQELQPKRMPEEVMVFAVHRRDHFERHFSRECYRCGL